MRQALLSGRLAGSRGEPAAASTSTGGENGKAEGGAEGAKYLSKGMTTPQIIGINSYTLEQKRGRWKPPPRNYMLKTLMISANLRKIMGFFSFNRPRGDRFKKEKPGA
jgi:hypothetical protein